MISSFRFRIFLLAATSSAIVGAFCPLSASTGQLRSSKCRPVAPWNVPKKIRRMISSGFSFAEGEQILISAQKPLGMILEQHPETGVIEVTELDPAGSAGKAGVQVGDVLVAVQNASTDHVDLDRVLDFCLQGPRVLNLRFTRTSMQE